MIPADRWERVFGLFDAAIRQHESGRAAYLAQECRDDVALRDDVQSLIDAHFLADGFLSADHVHISHAESATSRSVPPMLDPGSRLGVFDVEAFIGAGGMGEVYLARDTRLDRHVAIKVLSSASGHDPRARARFAYEARAIARLSHPRICALHDIGHHNGVDFLVMEYLQGEPLSTRLRRGPLSVPEAIQTAIEIGEALAAAHAQGITHRDLKPANIMLTQTGARLLDFGLARLRDSEPLGSMQSDAVTVDNALSRTGLLVGTLPYMAPEQLRQEDVDQRTDLFAFGTVLYEMITGNCPFMGDSAADVVVTILERDPVPLSDRRPMIPPALSAVVTRCLQKDPVRRWQTAHEMVVALTAIAGERNGAADDTHRWRSSRRRARFYAASAIFATLATGGGWAWLQMERPPSRIALAVLPFDNLGRDPALEYLADGLSEETSASLGQVDPERLTVIGRTSTLRYRGTTKSVADIGHELGVDYVVESSLRVGADRVRVTAKVIRVRDQIQIWSQSYDRSLTDLLGLERELSAAVAEQIRLRLSPERQAAIAHRQSANAAAYDLFLRGRFQWNQLTPPTTKRALEYYSRATTLDSNYALAWSGIADAYSAGPINGDAPPQQFAPRAREAVTRAIASDGNLAEARASEGAFKFWLAWDWPGAEASLRRAIALDPNYSFEHELLGMVLSHMGRHDEAAAAIRRARELDPLSAAYQALSAQVAFNARDYPSAIQLARQAIVMDPAFWIGYQELAQAYEQTGQTASALEAISAAERFSNGGNSKTVSLRGYVLARSGRANEAREAVAVLEAASRDRYIPPYATALIYAGLGDREAVFEWLDKAFAAHDVHLAFLSVDAKWDPYRADPRFKALELRCGFRS